MTERLKANERLWKKMKKSGRESLEFNEFEVLEYKFVVKGFFELMFVAIHITWDSQHG